MNSDKNEKLPDEKQGKTEMNPPRLRDRDISPELIIKVYQKLIRESLAEHERKKKPDHNKDQDEKD